jgi:hypothetical protein
MTMSKEEVQERLDRAKTWMARNTGLRGTHEYLSREFEEVFARRRLAQLGIDSLSST